MCLACVVRLQVANVPARIRCATGVQAPPTLSISSNHAERGKVPTPPGLAMPGKPTVRQAYGGGTLRNRNKQRPSGSRRDTACNTAAPKRRGFAPADTEADVR